MKSDAPGANELNMLPNNNAACVCVCQYSQM